LSGIERQSADAVVAARTPARSSRKKVEVFTGQSYHEMVPCTRGDEPMNTPPGYLTLAPPRLAVSFSWTASNRLEIPRATVEQMRLVNALCWARAYSGVGAANLTLSHAAFDRVDRVKADAGAWHR
jgi:hypothetical protein